jgi:hypothetical protein
VRTQFLDLAQLQEAATRVRLKPGWALEVYEDRWLGPYARFTGTEPDGYNPGQTVGLGIDARIPPCRARADFMHWVAWRWAEIWIHEARESFWVNDQLWDDPHAGGEITVEQAKAVLERRAGEVMRVNAAILDQCCEELDETTLNKDDRCDGCPKNAEAPCDHGQDAGFGGQDITYDEADPRPGGHQGTPEAAADIARHRGDEYSRTYRNAEFARNEIARLAAEARQVQSEAQHLDAPEHKGYLRAWEKILVGDYLEINEETMHVRKWRPGNVMYGVSVDTADPGDLLIVRKNETGAAQRLIGKAAWSL